MISIKNSKEAITLIHLSVENGRQGKKKMVFLKTLTKIVPMYTLRKTTIFKSMIAQGSWFIFGITVFLLTVLLWAFSRSMFRIIFLPASKPVEKISISPWESVSQLILFILAAYIGFNPPAFLGEILLQAAEMIW